MKNFFNKATTLLLILCLAFGMVGISAAGAYAEDEDWQIDAAKYRWVGDGNNYLYVYDYLQEDYWEKPAYISAVYSSNSSVLKPKKVYWFDEDDVQHYDWVVNALKSGKAKITVDFVDDDFETYSLTKTITVRKYPYQIKSLKVNGKTVKVSKHKYSYSKYTKKTKVKVKMALKKGWKIAAVYAYKYDKDGNEKEVSIRKSSITKGRLLSFASKYENFNITVYMSKGSKMIYYNFNFHR